MNSMEKILLIDDDEGLVHFLSRFFTRKGYAVTACSGGRAAIDMISRETFDLILLDYKMPDLNGLDTLSEIRAVEVKTPVIMMTAYGTTDLAIEAMKRGAYDYLVKPFERRELSRITAEALEVNRRMKEKVHFPAGDLPPSPSPDRAELQIIGNSRIMRDVYKLIGQIAEKDVSVLITGESGTGKELVARAIYHHSRRSEKPFIAVNCAAIPETLFESELFGHERGAFTGAERTYIGKLERCHHGTLFLDEIGDMSPMLQAKLLRVLQEGEVERLGGSQMIRVDVRIIAATNKNLEEEVAADRFRRDLYWRLKVISINMPSLRQRLEDIPLLTAYFLQRFSAEYNRPVYRMSDAALARLTSYSWPGNVRELENCVRRAVLLCAGEVISGTQLMLPGREISGHRDVLSREQLMERLREKLEDLLPEIIGFSRQNIHANVIETVEEILIRKALEISGNNQVQAARMLGISRNTLRHRLRKHNDRKMDQPVNRPTD
jgi:DNA-binding NtrC family response regulator